jgi:predicted amidohydrolase
MDREMTQERTFFIVSQEGLPSDPDPAHVRLAGVQMDIRIADRDRNLGTCLAALEQARDRGASLIVFPECTLTGYAFADLAEARDAALPRTGPQWDRLIEACRDLGVHAVVGYLERTAEGVANTASTFGPQGAVAHYRKTHLPFLGSDKFVERGGEVLGIHEVDGIRLAVQICFDASFPEVTRLQSLAGADLVILPTNWPQEALAKASWLPNTRAYENVIYFAAINRVGEERGYRFHGLSRICGPAGETLVQGPRDRAALLLADVDPLRSRTKRIERRAGEYYVDRMGERREDLYRLSRVEREDES